MTMKLEGPPFGRLLAALVFGVGLAAAAFTNSFDGITSGSSVRLRWDSVPPQYYPLCITAQVIDKSGDGSSADAYRVNITSMSGRRLLPFFQSALGGHPRSELQCFFSGT